MNNREKKEWIIRYAKKQGFEDILSNKYLNKKEGVLKRYTNEIQAVCSLISVLFIGFASLIVSFESNEIAVQQMEINKYENKPILSVALERNARTGLDYVSIVNTGKVPVTFNTSIISYFNCLANENNFGSVPIRLYTLKSFDSQKHNSTDSETIAELILYNSTYPALDKLYDEFVRIVRSYTDLAWGINHTYLIRVDYVDVLNENNICYFICDAHGARSISKELGQQIYDECNSMILNEDGLYIGKERFYLFEDVTAEQVLRACLQKMRAYNLYCENNGFPVLYGEYEPQTEVATMIPAS